MSFYERCDSDFDGASQDISSPVTDVVIGVRCLPEEYYARGQYQEAERSAEVNV